jgi:hypothetical protein
MSQEHVEIVRSTVAGSMRGRAAVLAAALGDTARASNARGDPIAIFLEAVGLRE